MYCNNCDKEVLDEEIIFDYENNTLKHKKCGHAVEYVNKRRSNERHDCCY